jgi:organic hydroperoxide reductase OsmC/OhrA
MSRHLATIRWQRQTAGFSYPEYNREHLWQFAGGTTMQASAAPAYLGSAEHVDPEEAFVASISSCHMLTFLAICARKRLVVDSYTDEAVGYLEKNNRGRLAITHVELSPVVCFSDRQPEADELRQIHRLSHEQCFIANSIRTRVSILDLD